MMDRDEQIEAVIAEMIQQEYAQAVQQARVPPAEVIWIQSQMRAREEATRKALRPIIVGQAIAIAALLGALISLASRISLTWRPQLPLTLIVLVAASWFVLAPLALYLTVALPLEVPLKVDLGTGPNWLDVREF